MHDLVRSGILSNAPFQTHLDVRYALTRDGIITVYQIEGEHKRLIADYVALSTGEPEEVVAFPLRNLLYISGLRTPHPLEARGVFRVYQVLKEDSSSYIFGRVPAEVEERAIINIWPLRGPGWDSLIEGHGMLIYSIERELVTYDDPTFSVQVPSVTEEEDDWFHKKKIEFIDDCTDIALEKLRIARYEIESEIYNYEQLDGKGGKWDFEAYYTQLLEQAKGYEIVEDTRRTFKELVEAKNSGVIGDLLRTLVGHIANVALRELATQIDQRLHENPVQIEIGDRFIEIKSLEAYYAYWEMVIRNLNQLYPLLAPGRVGYETVLEAGEAGADIVRREILDVLYELREDNQQGQEYMEEDRESILTAGYNLHAFKVLLLPGVPDEALRNKEHDTRYQVAAHLLMGDQKAFSTILNVAEIFMAMFVPPIGFALGAYNTYLQISEASFTSAISDSALNVDDAYFSQEEAESAILWAWVSGGLTALELLGPAAVRIFKSVKMRSAIKQFDVITAHANSNAANAASRGGTIVERISPEEIGDLAAHLDLLDSLPRSHKVWFEKIQGIDDVETYIRQTHGVLPNTKRILSRYKSYYKRMMKYLSRVPPSARPKHLYPMTFDEYIKLHKSQEIFVYGRRCLDLLVAKSRASDALLPFEILRERAGKKSLRELFDDIPALGKALRGRLDELDEASEEFAKLSRILDEFENTTGPFQEYVQRFQSLDNLRKTNKRFGFLSDEMVDNLARIKTIESWARGAAGGAEEATEAIQAAVRLMSNREIDPRLLAGILNKNRIWPEAQRWAIVFDKIQGVEGFINRAAKDNPSLLETLVWGNRGHALEALVTSSVDVRYIEKISLGNRFPLNGDMVEADVLIRFRDGFSRRQLLIDTKFTKSSSMLNRAKKQMNKMHAAIMRKEIGVDSAVFYVSHKMKEGLFNARRTLRKLSGEAGAAAEKIHIVTNIIDEDWMEWFLKTDVPLDWGDVPKYQELLK